MAKIYKSKQYIVKIRVVLRGDLLDIAMQQKIEEVSFFDNINKAIDFVFSLNRQIDLHDTLQHNIFCIEKRTTKIVADIQPMIFDKNAKHEIEKTPF